MDISPEITANLNNQCLHFYTATNIYYLSEQGHQENDALGATIRQWYIFLKIVKSFQL